MSTPDASRRTLRGILLGLAVSLIFWAIVVSLSICLSGCNSDSITPTVVSTAPGTAAGKLNAEKDRQISDLKAAVAETEAKSEAERRRASSAAGNVHGVLAAAEHVAAPEDAPAKEAVVAEANLAASKLPAASPADMLAAVERINLLLTGQRDEAKAAYGAAMVEADAMKAAVAAHEATIARQKAEIAARDTSLAQLAQAAQTERDGAAKRIQAIIDDRDKRLAAAQEALRTKEINLVIKACIGIGSFFLAVSLGAAVFFVWSGAMTAKNLGACAAGFVASGLAFALSRFLAHPWLPWAVGGAIVLIVVIMAILFAKDNFDVNKAKQKAETTAKKAIASVGAFANDLRASDLSGDVKDKVIGIMDVVTDTDQQAAIRIAAATTPTLAKSP